MQSWFHDLSDYLQQIAGAGEEHGFLIHTEESDFIRFNNGRFRQCGSVEQRSGSLRLIEGGRQVTGNITFTGSMEQDRPRLRRIYDRLRLVLADLAQDRLLEPLPPAFRDEQRGAPSLPPTDEVISAIDEAAKGRDMVGHWLAGPVGTGYSSSTGVRRWFENETFQLDWSYVISGDLAVKNLWAGDNWQRSELRRRIEEADRQLELMAQPRVDLPRGEYRAYLAPEALSQIILLLGWSGAFSARALRTGGSSFEMLHDGDRTLSPMVDIEERPGSGLAPLFSSQGFDRPGSLKLLDSGSAGALLTSPRTAREFSLESNGAEPSEMPTSVEMAAGEIEDDQIAEQVGDGLWLENLHYLNLSDRRTACTTGLTRFAAFRVIDGERKAPIGVMRFDDSVLRLLGEGLLGLTRRRERLPRTMTYGGRHTGGMEIPGAIVDGFRLTL